jgi:hypothetical protein
MKTALWAGAGAAGEQAADHDGCESLKLTSNSRIPQSVLTQMYPSERRKMLYEIEKPGKMKYLYLVNDISIYLIKAMPIPFKCHVYTWYMT